MKKTRLAYIDVLKAGLILYVVVEHVLAYSLGVPKSFIYDFFELTAMPTFFLTSGYLAKSADCNTFKDFIILLTRKAQRLLLPTFACILLYIAVNNCNPDNTILTIGSVCKHLFWQGFWFTPTLFVISCLCLICQASSSKKVCVVLNLMIILASPIIMHLFWRDMGPISNCFCLRKTIEYIPFFSLGLILRMYQSSIQKLFQKDIAHFCILSGGVFGW